MPFENEFQQSVAGTLPETPPDQTDGVSFAPQGMAADAVSFAPSPTQFSNLPLEVTDSRAQKAHFALQDRSPGLDALKTQFSTGGEWDLRQKMAIDKNAENNQNALDTLQKVSQTEGPLTSDDVNLAVQTLKTKPVDPSTILETEFGKKFTQFGTTIRPEINQVFSNGWKYLPGETAFEQNLAIDITARKQKAISKLEEIEDRWSKTPWLGDPMDMKVPSALNQIALSWIPGYSWLRTRNALTDGKSPSFLQGNNRAEQVQSLWLINDTDKFASTLDAAIEDLWTKSPLDARIMAKAAVSFSNSDQLLANVFSWVDIASVAPVGTILKGGRWVANSLKGKSAGELLDATKSVSGGRVGNFNPYAFEEGRVGPASDLLPQDVRDKSRGLLNGSPPPEEGYTRFYRGDKQGGEAFNPNIAVEPGRWFSTDKAFAAKYGDLSYVDLSKKDMLGVVEDANHPGKSSFILDKALAERKTPYKEGLSPKGPVMNAKRGQTFDVNRGPTMQVERGAATEVPPASAELQAAINSTREMQMPLRGPTEPSGLPHLEGDVNRDQFLSSWQRYYRTRPWAAPSDINPDGSFPPALLPRRPNLPVESADRYDQMMQGVRQAMGDVVKASGEKGIDVETALVTLGDVAGAAKAGVNRIAQAAAREAAVATGQATKQTPNLYEFSKDLPSSFNPTGAEKNPVGLSRERTQAIYTEMNARGAGFLSTVKTTRTVERLPPEAVEQAFKEAENDLKYEFHTHADHILDFTQNKLDPYKNTRSVTMMLGNRGKVPFETLDQAELFARDIFKLNDEAYIVQPRQQGIGYTINVTKPITETESVVRDAIASTKYSQTPTNTLSNLLFGTWTPRSAEDLLSEFNRAARHTSTHSTQNLRAFFKDAVDDIAGLGKKERNEVQDILRANRDYEDKAGNRGQFYEHVPDFELAFQAKFNRLPTEAQVKAYFSYTQLSDMDWVLRNLGALRDKERLGIQEHRIGIEGGKTPWLEGKLLRDFPTGSSEDAGILIMKDGKTGTYVRRHDPEFDAATIRKMIEEENYNLVQLAEPHTRPLMELTGEKDVINFVLSNARETRPLPWKQVQYAPGGHVIYPYEWWVKQAQVATGRGGRLFYHGDANIFNFSSQKEAQMWATRMDEGRKLLDNEQALNDYVSKNIPYSVSEFKNLFKTHLDPDLPISHTQSGKTTINSDKRILEHYSGELRNEHDSSYNMYKGMDKAFLADRDLQLGTVSPTGDVLKPWKIDSAPAIDPYPALNRALGQVMRSRYMNDYKIAAAEEWVNQFSHMLGGTKEELRRKNPLSVLYNQPIVKVADGSSLREEALAAENARARIIDFIGSKSEFESNLNRIQNIVMDSIFSVGGKSWADSAATNYLPALKDPSAFMRAVAFHTHLGFFNPVQLWVQAMSMANSFAIAGPINGGKGAVMGGLQRFLAMTEEPAIIDRMANVASKVAGINPEHFKESYEGLKASGLWHVAGETAWRDNVFDPKLFSSSVGTFLDKGTVFFANGERQVRLTAWNTAYIEWRGANPTAEFTNKIAGDVLNRADTLSANMTRASNAAWQKGALSIPTQFYAYNARMMEQMLGSRLTVAEKTWAFATYSALFGIPAGGLGATVGVVDTYSDIRKAAVERGINLSPAYMQAMMEGIPSMLLTQATGKQYDIAKRMGPNGNALIEDAFSGKKSIDEVLGGASWQTGKEIAKTTRPFWTWAYNSVMGNKEDFPLQIQDFAGLAENASVFSNVGKTIAGIQTGKYVTKNGIKVDEINNVDSVLLSIFGIKPMHIEDTLQRQDVIKETAKHQESEVQRALTEYRKGMDAATQNDDYKAMKDNFTRATTILEAAGLNPLQKSKVWERFTQSSSKTVAEKVNIDWIKQAPSWYQRQRTDTQIEKTRTK